MEDIKQAIEDLKYAKSSVNFFGQEKSLDLAIEALEKQIPIKVSIEYDDEFTCPTCGETTEDYDVTTLKICPECGQKLEWS